MEFPHHERLAVQKHAQAVEDFKKDKRRRELAIVAKYPHDPAQHLSHEAKRAHDCAMELDQLEPAMRPLKRSIVPFDTPAEILKRVDDLSVFSERPVEHAAQAENIYRETLNRVLAFAHLAPCVAEIFSGPGPAILGLKKIREWCGLAMGEIEPDGRAPSTSSTGSQSDRRTQDQKITEALAFIFQHPDCTVKEVAQAVGVHEKTPYKWPRVTALLRYQNLSDGPRHDDLSDE